jgi:hypothetical protein
MNSSHWIGCSGRGYRDAISYAQTVPFVDAARIGILAFD